MARRARAAAASAALIAWAAVATPAAAFWCHSDIYFGPVTEVSRKGLALDDTTFRSCPDKVPEIWPNTVEVVTSVRLFKAWEPYWPEKDRLDTWHKLLTFLEVNRAKVLVGTQVTCTPEADEQDWGWTKELLALLGPEKVMGLAIGNEMDLLFSKSGVDNDVTPDCIRDIWANGRFWRMFSRRAAELDAMGFGGVALTTVFGGLALDGEPFKEDPDEAMVTSFFRNATDAFGSRFAFTFNFYPYFDPTLRLDPNTTDQCQQALAEATCFSENCSLPRLAARTRRKIQQITNLPNSTFWIGETGWSSPTSGSLSTPLAQCKEWSAIETFAAFYSHFLRWDMTDIGGVQPPDHIFYFTARNSLNYGVPESFGLTNTCMDQRCKLHSVGFMAPGEVPAMELGWTKWAFAGVAGLALLSLFVSVVYVKLKTCCAPKRHRPMKEPSAEDLSSSLTAKNARPREHSGSFTKAPSCSTAGNSTGLQTFSSNATVSTS